MNDAARPAKKPSPTFPVYWKDWLADATFLTAEARGVYATLMMLCWQHEMIPSDRSQLAPACGVDAATMERVWPSLARLFQPAGSLMLCNSVEESRSGQEKFRQSQKDKSVLGVAARAAKRTPGSRAGKAGVQPRVQPQHNPDATPAVAVAVASADAASVPSNNGAPPAAAAERAKQDEFIKGWMALFSKHRAGAAYAHEGAKDRTMVLGILKLASGDVAEALRRAEVHLMDSFWAERGANLGTLKSQWNRCVHGAGNGNGHKRDVRVGQADPSPHEAFNETGRIDL